jgi:hypothetical protein
MRTVTHEAELLTRTESFRELERISAGTVALGLNWLSLLEEPRVGLPSKILRAKGRNTSRM